MALTDIQVKAASPREKLYKISDSGGLQLHVSPSGGKLWRYAYRHHGLRIRSMAINASEAVAVPTAVIGKIFCVFSPLTV